MTMKWIKTNKRLPHEDGIYFGATILSTHKKKDWIYDLWQFNFKTKRWCPDCEDNNYLPNPLYWFKPISPEEIV